jgi:hypothetical protein
MSGFRYCSRGIELTMRYAIVAALMLSLGACGTTGTTSTSSPAATTTPTTPSIHVTLSGDTTADATFSAFSGDCGLSATKALTWSAFGAGTTGATGANVTISGYTGSGTYSVGSTNALASASVNVTQGSVDTESGSVTVDQGGYHAHLVGDGGFIQPPDSTTGHVHIVINVICPAHSTS